MSKLTTNTQLSNANFADQTNGVKAIAGVAKRALYNNAMNAIKTNDEVLKRVIPSDGHGHNIGLTVSTSGALVVTLVGEDGNAPSVIDESQPDTSSNNPVYVRIGGQMYQCAVATGGGTSYLSVSLANGTNWFGLSSSVSANNYVNLFVYVMRNIQNSKIHICLSRIPYAKTLADFDSTSTDEKGVVYDTSGITFGNSPGNYASLDNYKVEVIGRIRAKMDGSNNWVYSGFTQQVIIGNITETEWMPLGTSASSDVGVTVAASGTPYRAYKIIGDTLYVHHRAIYSFSSGTPFHINFPLPMPSARIRNIFSGEIHNVSARAGTYDSTVTAYIYRYDGNSFPTGSWWTAAQGSYPLR